MIIPRRSRWRIGTVAFINARPLDCGLADRPDVELVRDTPSRLTAMMEADELDAALLPTIAYFRLEAEAQERHRHRRLVILPGGCISSRGPVRSVLLFCRTEIDLMRHVALDPNSHTSNCLVRLVLSEVYASRPHFRWPTPDPAAVDRESDGLLLIGDRAMTQDDAEFYRVLDLGEAWQRFTGQPFVYAVWAAREADDLERLAAILQEARAEGAACREELARQEARRTGLDAAEVYRYLTENIHYDLGGEELAGLQTFYRLAADDELAPLHIPIRLAGGAAPGERDGDVKESA